MKSPTVTTIHPTIHPGQITTPRRCHPLRRVCGLALAALGFGASLAVADTTIPVANGSFEITNPGDQTWTDGNWMYIPSPWTSNMNNYGRIKYGSGSLPALADGGTWVANMTDSGYDVITQNLGSHSFTAGDTLAVTFYLERDPYGSGGGELQASFLIGATSYSHVFDTTTQTVNTWQSYTLTKTIPAGVTGNLSLKFSNVSGRVGWLDKISDVTVTPAPPPSGEPTSTNATLTALEDTATALSASDFGYADPNLPPSPLAAVRITSLPAKGMLKNGGVTVGSGDLPLEVVVGNIPNLTYQSALNGNGAAYTTIGIMVKSENNLWSLAEADLTVNVTPVNDPPTSTGGSVGMKANTVKTFTAANFQFSDVDAGDTLHAIMVTSLPVNGTLKLGGTPITTAPSAAIAVANIGTLTYTPNTDYSGSDPFNFQVSDGTACSADAIMAITITVNMPPTSTGGSVILRTNTVKTFTATDFPFADADSGDSLSAVKVTSLPANGGTLTLGGTAITAVPSDAIPVASIGTLTYTPVTNHAGADSFKFQVSDGIDFSADATMAITVTPDVLVLNGDFENPTPHNPNNGTNADWTAGGWAFVGAPWTSATANYGRLSQGPVASPQLGNWIYNLNGDGTGWIRQDLGTTVNAGDTLAVTFHVMSDTAAGQIAAAFQVGAGPTEYSQTFNNPQNNNTWVSYTLTQTIAVSGNLSLKFSNVSGRLWLDNVGNVSVTNVPTPGTYAAWAATNGATGQTLEQDHDNDGVPNGIEYFLGGSANTTGFTPLPGVVDTAGTLSVTWTKAADYPGVYGTDYVVQTSTVLAADSWTNEPDTGDVSISGNNVTYTFPSFGPVKKFARLKVMGPP